MIRYVIVKCRNFIKQQFDSYLNDETKISMNMPLFSNPYKRLLFAINFAIRKNIIFTQN